MLEFVFNKIAGIDFTESINSEINSIDLHYAEKKLTSRCNASSGFGKIAGCALPG